MPALTVESANVKPGKENVPNKFGGANKVIVLQVRDGDQLKQAEWFTRVDTPIPQKGMTLDGTLEQGQHGLSFKKAQQQGFGAPRPEDPVRAARILRQHSQHMSLLYVELKVRLGKLEDFTLDDIKVLTDRFDADAKAAAP